MSAMHQPELRGHNAAAVTVRCQLRLFNSICRYRGENGSRQTLELPAGSDLSALPGRLGVPRPDVFLIFVNGRDMSPESGRLRLGYMARRSSEPAGAARGSGGADR